jgi:acyl carrier protein phosphodiesterase
VVRRAVDLTDSSPAFEIFEQEYQPLQELFRQFWPELRAYTYGLWKELNDKD